MLHTMGYRFRIHRSHLPGTPDIVLKKHKTIIFCHGCFWHQHPGCRRATTPKSNTGYWIPKLERNKTRFRDVRNQLEEMGWKVAVIWECETKDTEKLGDSLEKLLKGNNHEV